MTKDSGKYWIPFSFRLLFEDEGSAAYENGDRGYRFRFCEQSGGQGKDIISRTIIACSSEAASEFWI
jgi:hypothetical protein